MNTATQTPAQQQTEIARQQIAALTEWLNNREANGKVDSEYLKTINRQLADIIEPLN